MGRWVSRQTHREMKRTQTDRKTERPADRKTERQADRKTERQADRKKERQIDRQTDIQTDVQGDRLSALHTAFCVDIIMKHVHVYTGTYT